MIGETSSSASFNISRLKEMMEQCAIPDKHPHLARALREENVIILSDHEDRSAMGRLHRNLAAVDHLRGSAQSFFRDVRLGIDLWREGWRLRNAVFVTIGESLASYVVMAMQFLSSPLRRPLPHVMVGCFWEGGESPSRVCIVALRKFLINRTVHRCIVNGKSDLRTFSTDLGICGRKLGFLPFHHTLDGFEGMVEEGDYVFSGGYSGRDYAPLIRACKELALPLKIATGDPVAHALAGSDPSCEIRKTSPSEFLDLMAKSRLVVLPYGRVLLRTGGHQTFINAMLMGKAVIVLNRDTAEGYFEDGKNGIIIDSGDYEHLKKELEAVYHFDALRSLLGANALKWVLDNNLCRREWTYRVYDIALEGHYRGR